MKTINLLTYCKTNLGAFEDLFPIEWLSPIIAAFESGEISRTGLRIILAERLTHLQAVRATNSH